jgi:hypothetical protein
VQVPLAKVSVPITPLSLKPVGIMKRRLIKRKLLRTRISLEQTLKQILNINRKRRFINSLPEPDKAQADLEVELRILNQTASNQAQLVRRLKRRLEVEEI